MLSKNSLFNVTLFRKNLGRFWPLWGGATALGCLLPLYWLLYLLQYGITDTQRLSETYMADMLYGVLVSFVPVVTMIYAILVAMTVWGYLYSARAVGLMHTLPIHRTALFITNTLSGLAMLLIPYAAAGILVVLIGFCWGVLDITAVSVTILGVLLLNLLFFGMATLTAMSTGHLLALPVFYFIGNFLAAAFDWLIGLLQGELLLGINSAASGQLNFLSPLIQIYSNFDCNFYTDIDGVKRAEVTGMGGVALYGLLGVALLVLGWLLYRNRDSERAGDVVAFSWLRPLFRYGVAFMSAISFGYLLYMLFRETVLYGETSPVPLALFMVVAGLVGYYVASMLLSKSLRVFRKSWKGSLAVGAGAVALCMALYMDLFNVEGWVPSSNDVVRVSVWGSDIQNTEIDAIEDAELLAEVLSLHQKIVDDAAYFRSFNAVGTDAEWCVKRLGLVYTLANGRRVERSYALMLTRARWETEGTADNALMALVGNPDLQRKELDIPKRYELAGMHIYSTFTVSDMETDSKTDLGEEETSAVYDALLQDAQEGRLYAWESTNGTYSGISTGDPLLCVELPVELYIEFRQMVYYSSVGSNTEPVVDFYDYENRWINVHSGMEHTLQTLMDLDLISEETLETWIEENT